MEVPSDSTDLLAPMAFGLTRYTLCVFGRLSHSLKVSFCDRYHFLVPIAKIYFNYFFASN